MKTNQLTLDEINRALDLARERDPSIEPEPGYRCAAQTEESCATVELTTTNLAILTAAALSKGHTPNESFHVAKGLYHDIEQLARQYASVDDY